MYMHYMHIVPEESKRGHQIPRTGITDNYVLPAMWMLGAESRSRARASALKLWGKSPRLSVWPYFPRGGLSQSQLPASFPPCCFSLSTGWLEVWIMHSYQSFLSGCPWMHSTASLNEKFVEYSHLFPLLKKLVCVLTLMYKEFIWLLGEECHKIN